MAAAIPFIVAASAAVSAISAIRQGEAASAAGRYNAEISTQNAAIARQQTADRVKQQERETYLRLGAIRAAQGKSGGTADSGSVLDVLGDAAAQSELEKQSIIYQGELAARGYTNTAQLDTFSSENARTSGYLKAGSELLGGAADTYTVTSRLKRG